jgi:hypothetical protein
VTVSRTTRRTAGAVAVLATAADAGQLAGRTLGWIHGWPVPLLLVAAPAWLLTLPWGRPPSWARRCAAAVARIRVPLLVTAVLAGTVVLWCLLQNAEPYLGHDESVYATRARSWVTDRPAALWRPYRPVGLPALGYLTFGLGDDARTLRLVGLALALLTLVITYVVAARLTTPRRAVVVILMIVSGLGFQRRLPEFLNDIGAAGLLVLVAYLVVRFRQRPGSPALLGAAAVAVAASYLRYGAASALVVLMVAAVLAWGPRVWWESRRQVLTAGCVLLAGLAPHFVYAQRTEGSPWGILLSAGHVAGREYVGDGLVYYALVFPFRLAGDLGGIVMAAGVVAAFLAGRRLLAGWRLLAGRRLLASGPPRTEDQVRVFFGVAAVLHVLVLGLTAHGEERFVVLSVLLLTIVGVDAIADLTGRSAPVVLTAVAALAVLAAASTCRVVTDECLSGVTAQRASIVEVARHLPAHRPCVVVTGYQPEFGWYSGCATMAFTDAERAGVSGDRPVHFVLFDHGRDQPSRALLRRLIGRRPATTTTLRTSGSLGAAYVVTLSWSAHDARPMARAPLAR